MTYMSRFARPLSRDEIDRLGAHAARRNAEDGITGVLLTLGSVFFQVFEGDDGPIDDLYARVLRDDRHTDIICLRTELDVTTRLFPDWSMNMVELDRVGGDVVEPLKLVLDRIGESQHIIERYTQPAVSRIMRQGLDPLQVPLREVDRLVLFTDMVGFSSISNRLPMELVAELVTTYLETCSTRIARRGGEVTKYLGDGVMSYFDADDADEALQSCVDIRDELGRIRDAARASDPRRLLLSGFGLALGRVIEGSIGSSVKMDYTIIGEPVNSAARLESLTRTLDVPILMSEAVAHTVDGDWPLDPLGAFELGRGPAVPVYGLHLEGPETAGMRSLVDQTLDLVAPAPS